MTLESVPAPPRRPKWFFRGAIALLWLPVLCMAIEVVFDIQARRIEHSNTYVRAWRDGLPWMQPPAPKDAWVASADVTAAKSAPAIGTVTNATVPDELADRTRRARFFAEIAEPERERFAALYSVVALECDRDGQIRTRYPKFLCLPGEVGVNPSAAQTLAAALGQSAADELRPALLKAFETGKPALQPLLQGKLTVFLYPLEGASHAMVLVDNPPKNAQAVPPDSIWDIPFLTCKKHMLRPDGKYWTNNFGFRDDDVVVPKPKGRFRIVCIGGSTTEEGDTNAMTYPKLLERKLRRAFGDDIEVVNCGLSGMNSLKEWMRAADYLALEPDFIVYYNGVNDICHQVYPKWVNERSGRLVRLLRMSRFINYYFNGWLLPSEREMASDFDKEILTNLRLLSAYFAKHGTPMAVCSFASPDIHALSGVERAYYDWSCEKNWGGRYVMFSTYWRSLQVFNGQVRGLCKETGMLYIPVAERFNDGTYYFGDICHMKNEGINLKAQAIFEGVQGYVGTRLHRPEGGA